MGEMKELIPEMIEVFEQSREHLDTLRDGQFANLGREIIASDAVALDDGRGGMLYEEWDTFEWLSDEERNSLSFLFSSEELSRNFTWIVSGTEDRTLTAVLFEQGGGSRFERIEVWHGEEGWLFRMSDMHDLYSLDLGGGYTLWVYTVRGPASLPFLSIPVTAPLIESLTPKSQVFYHSGRYRYE